jgi:O-antigen/teichoic acid export membrane protein
VVAFPFLALFFNLPYYWLIPFAAFLYTFTNLNHLSLMGQRQVAMRNYSLMVFPLILFLGIFIFSLIQKVETSDYYPFLFTALFVSALVSWVLFRKHLIKEKTKFRFEWNVMKNGVWVQTGQAIQFLNYRLNFFLVAFFINDAALGIFNNAVVLCESLWILGHSMGQIQHLNIVNNANQSENLRLTKQMITKNVLGTLVLLLVLISLPNSLWIALFSIEFETMRSLVIYLSPGILAFSVSNIIYHHLHAINRFKEIVVCNLMGLLSGLAASLILIPSNGLTGASISWSIGLLVAMISYVLVFYRFHGNKIN